MKKLRIVCGGIGALHYSASPDVAMDNCPICGEACREIELDTPKPKTLLDLLHEANAIEIDSVLCTSYTLESEETEDNDIALDISYEEGCERYEHFISFSEMDAAEYNRMYDTWKVNLGSYNVKIKCYKLTELKP